jgi:hypothetical protein
MSNLLLGEHKSTRLSSAFGIAEFDSVLLRSNLMYPLSYFWVSQQSILLESLFITFIQQCLFKVNIQMKSSNP